MGLTSIPWKILSAAAGGLCLVLIVMLLTANAQKASWHRKFDKEVEAHAQTKSDLAQCRVDKKTLAGTIRDQNDAVADLVARGRDATRRANQGIKAAEREADIYRRSARVIGAAPPSGDLCEDTRQMFVDILRKEGRQ